MSTFASFDPVHEGDVVWLTSGRGPFTVVRVSDRALLIREDHEDGQYLRGALITDIIRVEKQKPHQQ